MNGTASQQFFGHFARELAGAGYTPEQSLQYLWRPYDLADLKITGDDRDRDLSRLSLTADDIRKELEAPATGPTAASDFSKQKIVLVVVPGFTHETLRNLSFHEEIERASSPHEVMLVRPSPKGIPSVETHYSRGGSGLKVVYAKYPRSNAASEHINEPLFELLSNSRSLRQWVDQGYKLLFVGYSYGCPLTLELLSDLNRNRFEDDFILPNTLGFLAMCGAIGGAYLADDVLKDNSQLFSIPKLVKASRKYPLVGQLAGLPTEQFKEDMVGGITSLTRSVRKARMQGYVQHLPAHIQYFSIGAVMPLGDYERPLKHLNFDDYSMFLQAKVSDPFSVYNDGQVVLEDNLIPQPDHIPANNHHHLGAVRAHHWSVSYKTFNFGNNRFPRRAFYRALINSMHDLGAGNPA